LKNLSRWVIYARDHRLPRECFRIIIFADDHAPVHVHAFGDGHAKINLIGADGAPEIVTIEGMKRGDARRLMRIIVEQRDYLLSRWRGIHG